MRVINTVKIIPSEPGEVFSPGDIHTIIEGYKKIRDNGTLGQPELVDLRFLVEGSNCVAQIEVPGVQETAHIQAQGEPVIE